MTWIKHHKDQFPPSFLIETKVSRDGKAFPFRELSEKEERLLLKAKHDGLLTTFSDYDRLGTPCDGACISGGGFIFLQYVRRANKTFYVIDIDDFIKQRDSLDRKSLEEWRAATIATVIGRLA